MRRRRREPDEPRPAGEVLAQVLADMGLAARIQEREAVTRWPELVGEEVARRSEALRIRDGVLFVRVDSAAWRQELHFLKSTILDTYRKKLGPGRVHDIRFTEH